MAEITIIKTYRHIKKSQPETATIHPNSTRYQNTNCILHKESIVIVLVMLDMPLLASMSILRQSVFPFSLTH